MKKNEENRKDFRTKKLENKNNNFIDKNGYLLNFCCFFNPLEKSNKNKKLIHHLQGLLSPL